MKIDKYIENKLDNVEGKTIIITGANSGLGFLISKTLVGLGANVVMAVRNFNRGEKAKKDILKQYPEANINMMHFDLDDFNCIDEFIDDLINNYPNFDGLILNAGILDAHSDEVTMQGFPKVCGDNYLSLLYLLIKLKPYLSQINHPCKIIFQGSLMSTKHRYKANSIANPNSRGLKSYSYSKLGVENLFYRCSIEGDNSNVKYLLAEPGACKTNIYRDLPKWLMPLANAFMKLAFHSPLKGSLPALNLMCNVHENGDILVPRGLGHFSGYPKKIKIPRKVLKYSYILQDGENLISKFIN